MMAGLRGNGRDEVPIKAHFMYLGVEWELINAVVDGRGSIRLVKKQNKAYFSDQVASLVG